MTVFRSAGLCGLVALVFLTRAISCAHAAGLSVDLTEHLVRITTGFSGAHVVVFGAFDGGTDLILIVRGPERVMTVREKSDVAGVWLNRHSVRFDTVPAFYQVLTSRPLADILPTAGWARNDIGSETLALHPEANVATDQEVEFRQALFRDLSAAGLYQPPRPDIEVSEDHLFRAELDLPATVPVGDYDVRVLLMAHGSVVASRSMQLLVAETGAQVAIRSLANDAPIVYGLLAVLAAAGTGWVGNIMLRSGR